MIRRRGQAPDARPEQSGPLCRRLYPYIRESPGRRARARRPGEAVRSLRDFAPSDQDRFIDFRPLQRKGHGDTARFDFPGFTHLWGKSRRGRLVVRQFTARDRFARATRTVHNWCRRNRHLPLWLQRAYLARAITGHRGYFGLTANRKRISPSVNEVTRSWQKWLKRRTRSERLNRDVMNRILSRYPLPSARLVHSIYTYRRN